MVAKALALLTLVLFCSSSIGAQIQFPLDLTCEMDSSIVYLHFEEDEKESWIMPHASLQDIEKTNGYEFHKPGTIGIKNKIIKNFRIFEGEISFTVKWSRFVGTIYRINRYTLGISHQPLRRVPDMNSGGRCELGFKTYNTKKF